MSPISSANYQARLVEDAILEREQEKRLNPYERVVEVLDPAPQGEKAFIVDQNGGLPFQTDFKNLLPLNMTSRLFPDKKIYNLDPKLFEKSKVAPPLYLIAAVERELFDLSEVFPFLPFSTSQISVLNSSAGVGLPLELGIIPFVSVGVQKDQFQDDIQWNSAFLRVGISYPWLSRKNWSLSARIIAEKSLTNTFEITFLNRKASIDYSKGAIEQDIGLLWKGYQGHLGIGLSKSLFHIKDRDDGSYFVERSNSRSYSSTYFALTLIKELSW